MHLDLITISYSHIFSFIIKDQRLHISFYKEYFGMNILFEYEKDLSLNVLISHILIK